MNRFPKCFVGPEEPKQMWAQQVGVPPKSEKRKRKGTEVEKGGGAGGRESVPLTLKEQHANYIQRVMQMICKWLLWMSICSF